MEGPKLIFIHTYPVNMTHRSPASPPMALVVPDDVWFHIASFLSREELCELYTVNHAFFRAAIIALYEVITFPKVNKPIKRLCAVLRCVPASPWHVNPAQLSPAIPPLVVEIVSAVSTSSHVSSNPGPRLPARSLRGHGTPSSSFSIPNSSSAR